MATAKKIHDDLLTCVICTERFRDPITLQCNHTFCGGCLTRYTKTRPQDIQAKFLPCPHCRQRTKVPDPTQAVNDWVKQLAPNTVILRLLDTFDSASQDTHTSHCSLCTDEGEVTPATSWCAECDVLLCDTCLKAHRRLPASRHHDASDLSGKVKVRRKRVLCKEHKEEIIKFYCRDCNKAVCQTCCIISHRGCKSVVSVKCMLPEMTSVLTEKRGKWKAKIKRKTENMAEEKSSNKHIIDGLKKKKSEINAIFQKAHAMLDKKENEIMEKVVDITKQENVRHNARMKTAELELQTLKQYDEYVHQALEDDAHGDLLHMYQLCKSGEDDPVIEADIDNGNRTTVGINFTSDLDDLLRIIDEMKVEEITIPVVRDIDVTSSPVLHHTVDISATDDTETVNPKDIVAMTVDGIDTLVISDYDNKNVKSVYTRNSKRCVSVLRCESVPWGVTQLTHNQVAVTVPISRQIVTAEVSPDLRLLSTITTSKPYGDLTAFSPVTIAACSGSPPCVDILDTAGNVLRSITHTLFQKPYYLCSTKDGNILVSDCESKSVVCVTLTGDVVFTYTPTGARALKDPNGIISTSTGDILLADGLKDRVVHLTESGQFIRYILTSKDGLKKPTGLCLDTRGYLFVLSYKQKCVSMYSF